MNGDRITLKEILGWSQKELTEGEWSQLEAGGGAAALKKSLAGVWGAARPTILERVDALLDVSLAEILARAWNTGRELHRYRDREKYPPGKTVEVDLARHKVVSTHKPRIEVWIGEQKRGKVDFVVTVEISAKGLRLHIRDGRIIKIETGDCQAKGSLHCGRLLLLERETGTLRLPGTLDLGEGLEI